MIRLDNNITNSDWTKARAFDFPTIKTLDDFMRMIGDIPLSSFADLPWVQVAPPEIRDAILASVEKARFASRSEAGRYAAEIRWQGHNKLDEDQARKPVARDMTEVVKLSLDIYNEELSTEEQESIVNYTADQYADINGYFRRGSNDDDVVETAKMFDRTFNKASVVLGSDEIVYRGMSLMTDSKTLNWIQKLEIGDEFQDKGFVSTSYDKGIAEQFATPPNSKNTSVLFVIKTPKGTNVVAGNPSEDEIILPRGSTMIVSNIDKTVRGGTERYEIEMELLP